MKATTFALLAGSTAALILSGPASAGFLGITTESEANDGILTVSVFAEFDNPGEDFMQAVAGTHANPLLVRVVGGTFFQHSVGNDRAPNPALFVLYPSLRYDSFLTIGVLSFNPNNPGVPEGQPDDELTLAPGDEGWPGFGPSELSFDNAGWAIVPTEPQNDPFDPIHCYPGDGRVLIGRFSTEDGFAIEGTMLLQFVSDGEVLQAVESFGGGWVLEQVFVDDDSCPETGSGTQDDPVCSIQLAIELAAHDGEIIVEPGTYYESIDLRGKAIDLHSTGGADVTIIDATGLAASVVTCAAGEGEATVIDGFTITGGSAVYGGGMFNDGSSPTVTDCIFVDNFAENSGGGMHNADGSNPVVAGCVFIGNVSDNLGGGMANMSSNPVVTNCMFSGNSGVVGGGMMNLDNGPTVVNCTFTGNEGAVGGAMGNFDSSVAVVNCTISENVALNAGGMHNINSIPTVANSVMWGDSPNEFGEGDADVRYSIVQGGWPGDGNVDAGPRFVDPANGDYRLSPGSPCIDAGDNTVVPLDVYEDLDGNPRFQDAVDYPDSGNPPGGGPIVDMGAYEADALIEAPPASAAAVFRDGVWFVDLNGNNQWDAGDTWFGFGLSTDMPIAGDWNGDGTDEVGLYRDGVWFLDLNGNDRWDAGDTWFGFGLPTDRPVAGDWNGDGTDEVGIYRDGVWFLDLNGNDQWDAGDTWFRLGLSTDTPVAGDWNGDGTDEVGIYRDGVWFLDLNGNHQWDVDDTSFGFGLPADTPVAGDWNGDGVDEVGLVRDGVWFLDLNGNDRWDAGDTWFGFGLPTDTPASGQW